MLNKVGIDEFSLISRMDHYFFLNLIHLYQRGLEMGKHMRMNLYVLCLCGVIALAGCNSKDKAKTTNKTPGPNNTTLNTHFFVGTTLVGGTELWKSDGTDTGTTLVKEINAVGHSNPANFTQVGNTVYFTADDGVNGIELWKSDAAGITTLVKNIHPTGGSNPSNLLAHNSKLYFIASDDTASNALWESDGTDGKTIKVGTFSGVANLVAVNSSLYFTTFGSQLWKYDDGAALPPSHINTTNQFSSASQLTVVGTKVYFIANSVGSGYELWASDGTDSGTARVTEIGVGTVNGLEPSYSRLFNVKEKLVFMASTVNNNILEIWTSDATNGTLKLLVGNQPPVQVFSYYGKSQVANGDVYFAAYSNGQLWRTDGTALGTLAVTSKVPYLQKAMQSADGTIYVSGSGSLWKTNGTDIGTINLATNIEDFAIVGNLVVYKEYNNTESLIKSIDANGNKITLFNNTGGTTLFSDFGNLYLSHNGGSGVEPWISDGTATGTKLLSDINKTKSESSYPQDYAVMNGTLFFVANDGVNNRVLWKSDGKEAGTVSVTTNAHNIRNLVVSGGKLYFSGTDADHGSELWVSDGTPEGTHIAFDLYPGPRSADPYSLIDVNGALYFLDDNNGLIWKTNGTLEGIDFVSFISPRSNLKAAGNKFYFVANDDKGNELWVSDGTIGNTHRVKDINPLGSGVNSNNLQSAVLLGDILYFTANDGVNGTELWKTNGAEAGTQQVINLNGVNNGLDQYDSTLFTWNNMLYFTAYSSTGGNLELWKTDGNEAGTVQLTTFGNTNGQVSYSYNFAAMNGYLYFTATNGTDGYELWKTNGSVGGAVLVKDINIATLGASSNPYGFSVFNNTLFFYANDGSSGIELWKSNDTETVRVKDVYEGPNSGSAKLCAYNDNSCNNNNDKLAIAKGNGV